MLHYLLNTRWCFVGNLIQLQRIPRPANLVASHVCLSVVGVKLPKPTFHLGDVLVAAPNRIYGEELTPFQSTQSKYRSGPVMRADWALIPILIHGAFLTGFPVSGWYSGTLALSYTNHSSRFSKSGQVMEATNTQLLFLCTGNYYRSRFAEEVFNFRARAASINWTANSRGLRLNPRNAGPISEHALKRLEALGVPIDGHRFPEKVAVADFEWSAKVIALSRTEHYPLMRTLFPAYAQRICYWDVEDLCDMPPDEALHRIDFLVDRLIAKFK